MTKVTKEEFSNTICWAGKMCYDELVALKEITTDAGKHLSKRDIKYMRGLVSTLSECAIILGTIDFEDDGK